MIADAAVQKWTNWGASVTEDPEQKGRFHMFAAEMADHCTLGVWGVKSQVRAVPSSRLSRCRPPARGGPLPAKW